MGIGFRWAVLRFALRIVQHTYVKKTFTYTHTHKKLLKKIIYKMQFKKAQETRKIVFNVKNRLNNKGVF